MAFSWLVGIPLSIGVGEVSALRVTQDSLAMWLKSKLEASSSESASWGRFFFCFWVFSPKMLGVCIYICAFLTLHSNKHTNIIYRNRRKGQSSGRIMESSRPWW